MGWEQDEKDGTRVPFEMYYEGEILNRQITYSTEAGRNSKWKEWSEFYKKMDTLAKEIKQLKAEEENNLPIEEKIEEMVELVQQTFTQQILDDGDDSGDENYKTHEDNGDLQVNGAKIDNYKDFFGDANKEWEKALKERLDKLDWHIIYETRQSCVLTLEGNESENEREVEGEFDRKKLTMKNNCFHYDGLPITTDAEGGGQYEGSCLELFVGDVGYGVEPVWGDD